MCKPEGSLLAARGDHLEDQWSQRMRVPECRVLLLKMDGLTTALRSFNLRLSHTRQHMNPLKSLGSFLTSISIADRIKIELLTALAGIAAIVVGVLALRQADLHLRESIRSQEKINALQSYREYLKLTLDEPGFALGEKQCREKCSNPMERYQLFAFFFLNTAEQIYNVYQGDPVWENILNSQIPHHKDYLCDSKVKKLISQELKQKIVEVVKPNNC